MRANSFISLGLVWGQSGVGGNDCHAIHPSLVAAASAVGSAPASAPGSAAGSAPASAATFAGAVTGAVAYSRLHQLSHRFIGAAASYSDSMRLV